MAFGIKGLVDNIQASITGLVNDITGNPANEGTPAYFQGDQAYAQVQSQLIKGNWLKLSFPYTFSVVDITNTANDPGFSDFPLPLAPQAISQAEEFAINIIPTQGGTTTTHSGNRYKQLNIQGTTGIAPFRGAGGASRKDGQAIFQPQELKYKSGYEVFIHLRNWFRTYYEYKKKQGADARNLRLVFRNYKDGEFLIVELLKFTMDRQASKSLLYDYKLEFKVLSHLSFTNLPSNTFFLESGLNQALDAVNQARGIMLRSQDILRQVESTYQSVVLEPLRQATLAIKAFQGVSTTAADVGTRILKNTLKTADVFSVASGVELQLKNGGSNLDSRIASIKLPQDLESAVNTQGVELLASFGEGLMAMDTSVFPENTIAALEKDQAKASVLPRSFYISTILSLRRVKENLEDFVNLGDSQFDAIFNRSTTLSADFTKQVSAREYELLQAFNEAIQGIYFLISTDDLFKSTFDQQIADLNQRFNNNISLLASAAVRQIRYSQDDTLERIAQRELNDSARWLEIAELNNLKAPFVTDDPANTQTNVIRPGDILLIPTAVQNGFSQVPNTIETKTTKGLNEIERSLGTDLKLTKDFDLSLNNANDLEVVSGVGNMAQATLLKLSYEPGDVIGFPQMGVGLVPGTKFPALQTISSQVTSSLLQDARIERVEDLRIERDGSALFLSFSIKVKEVDIPVPVRIRV